MPAILNVLIGVTFVFLLFSLLVSALNEIILSTLDKRAAFLKEGLRELLQSPERVSDFLSHGLIDALSRKTDGDPSYSGKDPFVAAVLDLVKPANPMQVRTIADFQTAVAALPEDKFRQSLSAILDSAENNLEKFKQGLGAWYDHSMERVSGWYTRYAQKSLFRPRPDSCRRMQCRHHPHHADAFGRSQSRRRHRRPSLQFSEDERHPDGRDKAGRPGARFALEKCADGDAKLERA